jgi:tetratricopeptide (TPR) repeat protein
MMAQSAIALCLVLVSVMTVLPGTASAADAALGPKQLWDKGAEYASNKLYTDAIDYFTRAIQKNKGEIPIGDMARVFNSRGLAYEGMGNDDKAGSDFTNAIELDEKNQEFFLNRGRIFMRQKQYERARSDFSAVIALNPRSAAAYAGRARAYQETGNYDRAIADFSVALGIEPGNAPALYGTGVSQKAKGNDEKAIEAFDRLLKIEPNNASASYQKAGIYARSKKVDAACIWLEIAVGDGFRDWNALKGDPDFAPLRRNSCYQKVIAGK